MSLSPFSLIGLSVQSLLGSPVRSTLSAVGVFMGVAAVTATLQVRNISEAVIIEQMAEREAPQLELWVSSRSQGEPQPLTFDDLEFLQKRLRGITQISSQRWVWWVDRILFQDRSANPQFSFAVSLTYDRTTGRKILQGRFFNAVDFQQYRPVAIVDRILATELFETADPIGKQVYIQNRPFTIIGVIESKQMWPGMDKQGTLLIPLVLDTAVTGNQNLDNLSIGIDRLEDIDRIKEEAIALLQRRVPTQEYGNWNNVRDIIEQKKTLESVSRALLVVGGIALVVGGVGIANVTIASAIERTPEIGLRRAIGATQSDILLQFIMEAAIVSLAGGTMAIATVHGATVVISKRFELPYKFDTQTAAIALGSSVAVGVGAAFFPALRASQLDPVKALRGD